MPKATPAYTSFNSGELSDLIRGRSDLEQYFRGGLTFKNILALQYGPFLGRPGSMYSADTKTHSTASRLLEFKRSPTDAQIIEMGNLYFRYYTSAGQIAGPYETAHTYTTAELFDVQYAQSNDVITLVHEDHKPAKLTRTGPATWSLVDYDFVGTPYLDANSVGADIITTTATTGTGVTMTASGGHTPFVSAHVGAFWRIGGVTGTPEVQGYVKVTGHTSSTVLTVEVIETLTASATSGTNDWAEGAWSDHRKWPSRVAYHQNKLWMGRTTTEPNGIWASHPFIYDNFEPGTGLDIDGVSEKIPDISNINWIIGGRSLLVGTDKGEYTAVGDAATGLTPASTHFNRQTGWESEAIQPEIIGNYVYPIQAKGRKVREVFYFFDEDSYKSSDTTAVAEHITKGGIVDVAYQRNPYTMMYCVLGNGKIAVMTRESVQEVLAWTILDTDGDYESVAVIPHPTEDYDMVWAVVKRTIDGSVERHVEYFENPIIPDRQELCFYVDDGLRFNAYTANTGGTLTLSAVTGDGITITAGSSVFVAGDEDQRIRAIDADGVVLGELLITQYNSGTEVLGNVVLDFDSTTYIANRWGISVNDISGADHLEAKVVQVLVDGGTHIDLTVASGAVTLETGQDGFIIALGLPFVSRWKNMPLDAGSATGTARGNKKKIYKADFGFYRSLGMRVGGDEDHLNDLILRSPATFQGQVEPLFTGEFSGAAINSTYDYEGHIVIEQSNPLPLCVTLVVPHVNTNDI